MSRPQRKPLVATLTLVTAGLVGWIHAGHVRPQTVDAQTGAAGVSN